MSSYAITNSHVHNVVYATEQLMLTLNRTILWIGLDPSRFINNWEVYERGFKTWLLSGHLEMVTLQVSHRGVLVAQRDFTIDYTYGNGEGLRWNDLEALRYSIIKTGTHPAYCDYEISFKNKPGKQYVHGFTTGSMLSTKGFVRQNTGTSIGTGTVGVQASYWRKIS